MDDAVPLVVLIAQESAQDQPSGPRALAEVRDALGAVPHQLHEVRRRPGKEIDSLLTGRVLVVGDDADLAAVLLRLQRRELLAAVEVAFAPMGRTPFAVQWTLPSGRAAVRLAAYGEADLVPLLRDDNGGVLAGEATIGPVNGPVYVDEQRVLNGPARGLIVVPDLEKGLAVTVVPRRLGMFGARSRTYTGRAVQIGTAPAALITDGVRRPKDVERWVFYRHTSPVRLIRGVVD